MTERKQIVEDFSAVLEKYRQAAVAADSPRLYHAEMELTKVLARALAYQERA